LQSCGWAGKQDLDRILSQWENNGEYERAAALAVWHGDVASAVDLLQRGAEHIRTQCTSEDQCSREKSHHKSYDYAQILELTALSIAGYRGDDVKSTATTVWQKSSSHLLQRSEFSDISYHWGGIVYLRHILKFLSTIGIDQRHTEVLDDTTLTLSDRVAFACCFLSRPYLKIFLENCVQESQSLGNVEGIVITGIETKGIQILESYVDRTADIQTAALLTSRVVFPSTTAEFSTERRICAEWLQSYRSLLNTWQMWQSRAVFDVDRAQWLRKVKQRQSELAAATALGGKQTGNVPGRRMIPPTNRRGLRTTDQDIIATFPAQLDARCLYCSASLGLRKQDNQPNQWLSRMKDVLSCCPSCRKPLPRCAICMLPLGALNPYAELTRQRSRSVRPSSGGGTNDELVLLSSLPFAEWFTWCVRCKHGGHAHHMVGWFAKHNVCPVSGCSCQCQFDAMPKLCRHPNNNSNMNESDPVDLS
jgi:WD repeat-containing protein mio